MPVSIPHKRRCGQFSYSGSVGIAAHSAKRGQNENVSFFSPYPNSFIIEQESWLRLRQQLEEVRVILAALGSDEARPHRAARFVFNRLWANAQDNRAAANEPTTTPESVGGSGSSFSYATS